MQTWSGDHHRHLLELMLIASRVPVSSFVLVHNKNVELQDPSGIESVDGSLGQTGPRRHFGCSPNRSGASFSPSTTQAQYPLLCAGSTALPERNLGDLAGPAGLNCYISTCKTCIHVDYAATSPSIQPSKPAPRLNMTGTNVQCFHSPRPI